VTSGDDIGKLKALRAARERLETALATDEAWQVLRRSGAMAGTDRGETARLQAELRSNPLYRAWTNVNAAIEARQHSDACGAAAPRSSAPGAGGDPGPTHRQANDERAREGREPAPQPPPSEEEASVSFVAFAAPLAATEQGRPQRGEPWPAPMALPTGPGHDDAAEREVAPGVEDRQGEEAEVSLVSVDAKRHAGAVDRLLRALRGEPNPG